MPKPVTTRDGKSICSSSLHAIALLVGKSSYLLSSLVTGSLLPSL